MSIPYETLLEAARQYLPDGEVRDTSAWVAIALTSVWTVADIKSKHDFLFIKCHARITVRTIKHEYLQRHPLEKMELKFHKTWLSEELQVKHLKKRCPVSDSALLVCRAFELDHVERENKRAKRAAMKENVRRQVEKGADSREKPVNVEESEASGDDQQATTLSPGRKRKAEYIAEAGGSSDDRVASTVGKYTENYSGLLDRRSASPTTIELSSTTRR